MILGFHKHIAALELLSQGTAGIVGSENMRLALFTMEPAGPGRPRSPPVALWAPILVAAWT